MTMVDSRMIYIKTKEKVQNLKNEIEYLVSKTKEKEKELESLLQAIAILQELIPPPRGLELTPPPKNNNHNLENNLEEKNLRQVHKGQVGARAPSIPISLVRNARPGDHPLKPESFHYEVHAVIKEFGKISNKELQQYFSETNKRTLSAAVSGLYLGNYIKKEPSFGPSASPIYIYNSDTGHRPNKYVSKRMLKTAILAIDHIHNTGQDITPKKFRERSGIINQQTGKILLELIETGLLEKIGKKTYRKSQKWLDAESSHHRARL